MHGLILLLRNLKFLLDLLVFSVSIIDYIKMLGDSSIIFEL